jgi:hypothetical protein
MRDACRLLLALLGAVLGIVLAAGIAEASSFTLTYSTGDCSGSASGSTSLSFNSALTPTCTGAATTTVGANASLTTLQLYLDSSGTTSAGRFAEIRIQDTITVTGGTGTGTLVFDWTFDGVIDAGNFMFSQISMSNLGGAAFADFRACGAGSNVPICAYDTPGGIQPATPHTVASSETRSLSLTFTYDVPFAVDWRVFALTMDASCAYLGGACGAPPQTGTGTVDFFNTMTLQPLTVFNSSGGLDTGASVVSDSGFQYSTAAPAAVPEPGSSLLLGAGLVAIAQQVRKRRRTANRTRESSREN